MTLLLSMQVYAGTTENQVQDETTESVVLEKGNPDKSDTYPRTLIPFTCVYADGMVQLTLLGNIGEYTLIVTNQLTGEQWSVENAIALPTSTANGVYEVQIVTEDGSVYYGTYTLIMYETSVEVERLLMYMSGRCFL